MLFWNSYPFVRFTIILILGIISYDYYQELWIQSTISIIILIIVFLVLFFVSQKTGFYKLRYVNGFFALLIFFVLGGHLVKYYYHSLPKNHYLSQPKNIKSFSGIITSKGKHLKNYIQYKFEIDYINADSVSIASTGTIYLNVKKNSSFNQDSLYYGHYILVKKSFFSIEPPKNPSTFNYKSFLEKKGIYAHTFVNIENIKIIKHFNLNPLLRFSYFINQWASNIIDENITYERENSVISALLLGVKDQIDMDTKRSFAGSGTTHVLAVSGLHVGIFYLILTLLFGKLKLWGSWGNILFLIIVIGTIWIYASVTGLSPSVMRASTMFSLMAIGQNFSKRNNTYNILGFTAFILLVYDPYLIYSIGFQLSFIAVYGIVYLHPRIYRLFYFDTWIVDKIWSLSCVSLAAQISTFPFTIYYFHQFPTYFLVSNLFVIPLTFLILIMGLTMILTSIFSIAISSFLGTILQSIVWIMNEFIIKINELPHHLIDRISIQPLEVFLFYAILITLMASLYFHSFKTLVMTSLLLLFSLFYDYIEYYQQEKRHYLLAYNFPNKIVLDYIKGYNADLYTEDLNKEDLKNMTFNVEPFRIYSGLNKIKINTLQVQKTKNSAIRYGVIANQKIIIFDSTTYHLDFLYPIQPDIIWINNQSVKSLEWLQQKVKGNMIIFGDGNGYHYLKKMQKSADQLGVLIHSLSQKGALFYHLSHQNKLKYIQIGNERIRNKGFN